MAQTNDVSAQWNAINATHCDAQVLFFNAKQMMHDTASAAQMQCTMRAVPSTKTWYQPMMCLHNVMQSMQCIVMHRYSFLMQNEKFTVPHQQYQMLCTMRAVPSTKTRYQPIVH